MRVSALALGRWHERGLFGGMEGTELGAERPEARPPAQRTATLRLSGGGRARMHERRQAARLVCCGRLMVRALGRG